MTFALNFVGDICVWQSLFVSELYCVVPFLTRTMLRPTKCAVCVDLWDCYAVIQSFETPRIAQPLSGSVVLLNKYCSSLFLYFLMTLGSDI